MVTLAKVQTMIDVSVEMIRSVEPGSRPDEYAAREPFGTIVAIRSAVIEAVSHACPNLVLEKRSRYLVDRAYLPIGLATFWVLFGSAREAVRRASPEGRVEASQPPPRALTRSTAAVMRRCRIVIAVDWSLKAMV